MIEYYTLMHKGGKEEYKDNIFIDYGKVLTMLILYSSIDEGFALANEASTGALINGCGTIPMDKLTTKLEKEITPTCNYLLIRIDEKHIDISRRGNVYAKFINRGEVIVLSNGLHTIEEGDQIICGTSEFFKHITDNAILADAMTSISSEEWMDYLCCRISEATHFEEENMSAVTMIVRGD